MPRDLPLGNGSMQINFDGHYRLRDIFWPHVGEENHTEGDICHTGVWVGDEERGEYHFAWFDDDTWQRELSYMHETMVTDVTLTNARLGLRIECHDTVDFDRDIFLRRFEVYNTSDRPKEVRLFFHYDWHLYGVAVGDTVYYDPPYDKNNPGNYMIAYKGERYFLMSGLVGQRNGIDSWACGVKEVNGSQGTWRDAEDGHLQRGPIAQGSVDCTMSIEIEDAQPGVANTVYHWVAAGHNHREVVQADMTIRQRGPQSFIDRTANFWKLWANKVNCDWADVPAPLRDLYKRSLLIMRTQVDDHGAVIASTDFDILAFARDSYAYMWPRDAALVIYAFDEAGFQEPARNLFTLIHDIINIHGYVLHKYSPTGSLGSSWHPWADSMGRAQLPIQEDETALLLYALWHHYEKHHDLDFVTEFYRKVIKSAGKFMMGFREPHTGLPQPSYDLWEERRGILAFTVGAVWAGLTASANFCEMFGEVEFAGDMRNAANEIKAACVEHMYDKERKTFVRMVNVDDDGNVTKDYNMDSSISGLFEFGMFDANDVLIGNTMKLMHQKLTIPTSVGGLARYEDDYYQRASYDVTGNPWFICSLWMADYYIAIAQNEAEMQPALDIMQWCYDHKLNSGVLAEQVHPFTGAPLSVSPLTWSHAAYVTTMLRYVAKQQTFRVAERSGGTLTVKEVTPSGPVVDISRKPTEDTAPPAD